jgi:hypothetical protein
MFSVMVIEVYVKWSRAATPLEQTCGTIEQGETRMNRRVAIIAGIATLAVASYLVMYRFGGPSVIVLTGAEKAACALTVEVTEGPYWVSGMPELKAGNLNATNLSGDALTFDTDTIAKGLPDCQLLKVDATSTPASAVFDFRL